MPTVNGKFMTPDEAAKSGHCPETGIDMHGHSLQSQADYLWPNLDAVFPPNPEAHRRRDLLMHIFDTPPPGGTV